MLSGPVKKIVVGAATSILAAVVLASASTVIKQGNRITGLEAHREDVIDRLDRIEKKLDRSLFFRRTQEN